MGKGGRKRNNVNFLGKSLKVTIILDKNEYPFERPKLKRWLFLEEINRKIQEATEKEDSSEFLYQYYSLISVAIGISTEILYELPWIDVAVAYTQIRNILIPEYDFPMLMTKTKNKSSDWDYEGRHWFIWLNLFAKSYGWSVEYIENLDVDNAIALMHEIISDDFYSREWQYSLSDASVTIDPATKQGKYKPLPRPEWMQMKTKKEELPKVKIPKSMLPAGIVVKWQDNNDKHSEST